MKPPRGLTADEAALWRKVAATVTPLRPSSQVPPPKVRSITPPQRGGVRGGGSASLASSTPTRPPPPGGGAGGLDSSWDRKLARGTIEPDFTIDLHGASLQAAHGMLIHGLARARAMGARVVLLVTGKPRHADPADRTSRRGAIRAKVIDWLAASEGGSGIAAIRKAHRRHGGDGALYLVLRRER